MIHPQITKLLILQEHDIAIIRIEKELQRLPAEEAAIDQRLHDRSQALENLRTQARSNEAERKRIELEVQSLEQQAQRYQKQQLQTRSNTEYQALTHEIEHTRKRISELEDQELSLMQAHEDLLRLIEQEATRVHAYIQEADEARKEFHKKISNAQALLAEHRQSQSQAQTAVDPSALSLYQKILKSKKDIAIVPMRHQTCSGCHMKVVSQTAIDVKAAKKLVSCDHCGRLLFDPDDS
jgi:predicted  nucleic acid-binding Zn-ribbon protein